MFKIIWQAGGERLIETTNDLLDLLEAIAGSQAAHRSILVSIENLNSGECLLIGVGGKESVLQYVGAGGESPYFVSVGYPEKMGVAAFWYLGEFTEIPLRNCIPYSLAQEAARCFAEGKGRSASVVWELE